MGNDRLRHRGLCGDIEIRDLGGGEAFNARVFAWHLHATLVDHAIQSPELDRQRERKRRFKWGNGKVEGLCPYKLVKMALKKRRACSISIHSPTILRNGSNFT